MQFTPRESKLIERLRREERHWPYLRWVMLAIGTLSLIVCTGWGWILYKLVHEGARDHLDSMDVFVIVMLCTKCCIWFVIGVWSVSTAWAKWRGDSNRALLLRLLDGHQVEHVADSPIV